MADLVLILQRSNKIKFINISWWIDKTPSDSELKRHWFMSKSYQLYLNCRRCRHNSKKYEVWEPWNSAMTDYLILLVPGFQKPLAQNVLC